MADEQSEQSGSARHDRIQSTIVDPTCSKDKVIEFLGIMIKPSFSWPIDLELKSRDGEMATGEEAKTKAISLIAPISKILKLKFTIYLNKIPNQSKI